MDKSSSDWKDRFGIAASALCAVHCAATPFLLVFLPTLQFTEWMASPLFHQVAAVICVALVGIAIIPAYRKHRDLRILSLSSSGLAMILAAAFLLPDYCCSGHHDHGHDHSHASTNKSVVHLVSTVGDVSEADSKVALCNHENCTHSHAAKIVKVEPVSKTLCTHEGCTHSHAASGESESNGHGHEDHAVFAGLSGDFWAVVQPWMTPVGGALLMLAHALNMKRSWGSCSKNCGCNKSKSSSRAEDGLVQTA